MPSVLCTPVDFVNVDGITVVGERINPQAKALPAGTAGRGYDYVLEQASVRWKPVLRCLDVNVGAPGVDEPA